LKVRSPELSSNISRMMQQQVMAQMATTAKEGSSAEKNLADAKAAGETE
jgi:hypothetical protein